MDHNKIYCVYILLCNDGKYYIGITSDLEGRLWQHENGEIKTCFTYNRRPIKLVYYEETNDVWQAINREKQLKGWSRRKKQALIEKNYEKLIEYSKGKKDMSS